jgi:hypothetical protein
MRRQTRRTKARRRLLSYNRSTQNDKARLKLAIDVEYSLG